MNRLLCIAVCIAVGASEARAAEGDVDILRLLVPISDGITGCRVSELLRIGAEFDLNPSDVPKGIPFEGVSEAYSALSGDHGYLYLYRVDPEYAEHLKSLNEWKHRESRGELSVLRTGPDDRYSEETVLLLGSGLPVYYWGPSILTQATLRTLDRGAMPASLQGSLENLRAATSDAHCFGWLRAIEALHKDLDQPEPYSPSSRLSALVNEYLLYWRIQGDQSETHLDLIVNSEVQLAAARNFVQLLAERKDELVFDHDEWIQGIAEMFYFGSVSVESSGLTLKLSMTGPKDDLRTAAEELDREREKRGVR